MTTEPTVFVVDDNTSARKSLQRLVESIGLRAETFPSTEEFLAAYDENRPGCLLLDVRLRGGRSGLDLQDELLRRRAHLPVIVMTAYGDVATSVRAMKGGAIDFFQKPFAPDKLVERIREAIQMDRRARQIASEQIATNRRLGRLTPREHEVMELLLDGKSSKEIAVALNLSARTIEGHRRLILRKLNVSSAPHLVRTVLLARRNAAANE